MFKSNDYTLTDQFQKTALLIGRENIDKLKNRRVAVFGVGGVGGQAAEALCRSGIGNIDIFDGDVVDVTNINRQIIATHKTVGKDKVDAMKERLLDINPAISVGAFKLFYLPGTADSIDLSVYDYIADAIDTMTAKIELVCRAAALNIPVISSMGAANKLDPTAFEVADIYETSVCPMARIMRKELRKRGVESLKVVYSKEGKACQGDNPCVGNGSPDTRPVPASIAFVPPVAGLIMAGEIVKDLVTENILRLRV